MSLMSLRLRLTHTAWQVHEWSYEGEIGEQTQPPEVLAARRAAARQAAMAAGMRGLPAPPPQPEDDFPSLSNRVQSPTLGWAALAGARGRPQAEDFPALSGGGSGRAGAGQRSPDVSGNRGVGTGGPSFRNAVEAYPTLAQELNMSDAGERGWCYDYPMPPPEPGGRGGGGGTRRVQGIGNMKLKIDKKAGKRKPKGKPAGNQQTPDAKGSAVGDVASAGTALSQASLSESETEAAHPSRGGAFPVAEDVPGGVQPRLPVPETESVSDVLVRPQRQQGEGTSSQSTTASTQPPGVFGELKKLLGEEAFGEVKVLSAGYRAGQTMPGDYFRAMQEHLPQNRFG